MWSDTIRKIRAVQESPTKQPTHQGLHKWRTSVCVWESTSICLTSMVWLAQRGHRLLSPCIQAVKRRCPPAVGGWGGWQGGTEPTTWRWRQASLRGGPIRPVRTQRRLSRGGLHACRAPSRHATHTHTSCVPPTVSKPILWNAPRRRTSDTPDICLTLSWNMLLVSNCLLTA